MDLNVNNMDNSLATDIHRWQWDEIDTLVSSEAACLQGPGCPLMFCHVAQRRRQKNEEDNERI